MSPALYEIQLGNRFGHQGLFFDNIDHELLMKAVRYYTQEKHILMYVERWLNAPVQLADGTVKHPNGKGTPQGGVISPVLANIFLDIVFDKWIFTCCQPKEYDKDC